MSLKNRLRISIVGLVVTIVLVLSLLNLHNTVQERLHDANERGVLLAQQVKTYVLERIREQTQTLPAQPTLDAQKQLWYNAVRRDRLLQEVLAKSVSSTSFVVEILVLDESNRVLLSSLPHPGGASIQEGPAMADLS